MTNSAKLNREKADRFRDYRRKWRLIAQDRQPIDQAKAREAIERFYAAFGLARPTIKFYAGVSSAYQSEQRKLAEKNRTRNRSLSSKITGWLWILGICSIAGMSQFAIEMYAKISPSLKEWLRQYGLDQIYIALEQTSIEGEDGIRTPLLAIIVFWIILFGVIGVEQFTRSRRSKPSVHQLPVGNKRLRFFESSRSRLIQRISTQLIDPIEQQLSPEVQTTVYRSLVVQSVHEAGFIRDWCDRFWQNRLHYNPSFFEELVRYEELCPVASYLDFCISELGCRVNLHQWQAFQDLLQTCGWIIAIEDSCIVCDRPLQFNFDQHYRFHAEGKPAIEYADGFKFYAVHGVALPERYGSCLPRDWKAEWLMTERNAEVRRLLIQEIGYDRICQELSSTVIDSWREYSLVRCVTRAEYEPFVFLKMTCPSTQHIHVIPVPPEMESAREAIRWVNWGIDPEEFEIES